VKKYRLHLHQLPKHPLPDVLGDPRIQITPLFNTQAVGLKHVLVEPAAKRGLLALASTPLVDEEFDLSSN